MIPQFALRLIVGLSLTWCLLPRRQITSGFFRIQMLVTLAFNVLVALTAPQWDGVGEGVGLTWLRAGAITGAIVSFVGSVLWTLERRRGGTVAAAIVFLLATSTLLVVPVALMHEPSPIWLRMLSSFSGAWLVGGLTGAMLLGHWYLTATGMPLQPLQQGTRLAQAAAATQLVVALLSVALAPTATRDALGTNQLVWSLLRWLAGIVGPLVLAWMTTGTLKYRNTQSATGVLFAGVILAFIGQAAALLLHRELGWPL
ncbi:MAG: hypothetical protein ACK5Q5_03320 [Planctomycetaceae bacterium]